MFHVSPGRYRVQVSSQEACWPKPDAPEKCLSLPYQATVQERDAIHVTVLPKGGQFSYECGWEVVQSNWLSLDEKRKVNGASDRPNSRLQRPALRAAAEPLTR